LILFVLLLTLKRIAEPKNYKMMKKNFENIFKRLICSIKQMKKFFFRPMRPRLPAASRQRTADGGIAAEPPLPFCQSLKSYPKSTHTPLAKNLVKIW
jgi:hypothetical protein